MTKQALLAAGLITSGAVIIMLRMGGMQAQQSVKQSQPKAFDSPALNFQAPPDRPPITDFKRGD